VVGGKDDGDERREEDFTLSSLFPTTIFYDFRWHIVLKLL
jgi:hypothetical protein